MSIFDWSLTAASNGNADATINFAEGQAPSTVNDSARALMARMAFFRNWSAGNMTQGGASNAYTITSGESLTAYTNGMRFLWKPNGNSSGAVTLNVDSIGAKKVYLPSGTQAGSGSIDADAVYDVVYQSALDSANGGFKIVGGGAEALGLGTAAYKNTGTSGDAVPLLNIANTWGAAQAFSNNVGLVFADSGGTQRTYVILNASNLFQVGNANHNMSVVALTTNFVNAVTINSNTVWHAGNDGAGSGLDADTVDGVQGSAFALIGSTNVFTAQQRFGNNIGLAWADTVATYRNYLVFNSSDVLVIGNANHATQIVSLASAPATLNGKAGARVNSGTATNAGLISWGTAAPGALAEGEIYLRYA